MSVKIKLPSHIIVERWKEEKVIKWLKKVQLDDCIPAFENRRIDGMKLLELTEQKLFTYQDLKIKHRKQIAKCVQECKSQATNAKRIARNLKPNHGKSQSDLAETNGTEDSDDDFDDWGSDFEDSDEEVEEDSSLEVNNNSINQSSLDSGLNSSGNSSTEGISQENSIPKPPDISIVPKSVPVSTILRNSNQTSCVPRPPFKRPPSQPPPPPIPQILSQEEEQEDYEIPIVSTSSHTNGPNALSLQNTSNETSVIETYEIVQAPEENYEIVDAPSNLQNMSEKPTLPPRFLKYPGSVSPPPLPQKPSKLKENPLGVEKTEGVKTFCRPKLPLKIDSDGQPDSSPQSSLTGMGFISSLMGRRSSLTPTSSPKPLHRDKDSNDGFATSPPNAKFLCGSSPSFLLSPDKDAGDVKKTVPLPPLPPRSILNPVDETAQNMATRPLPPVPTSTTETVKKHIETIQQDILKQPWYHEIERKDAETAIRNMNESGSFVVRPSQRAGKDNPFSLTVLHENKLFHLNIRQRTDNTFALGKEKQNEKTFPTVTDLIIYHQEKPILLKNQGEPAGKTKLQRFPEKIQS